MKYLDNTGLATYDAQIKSYINAVSGDSTSVRLVTLNTAPTESTTTYTIDGTTYNFKIGDEVRVASNGTYTYYKLDNLTTSNNTTTAEWGILGIPPTPTYTFTLNIVMSDGSATNLALAYGEVSVNGGTAVQLYNGNSISDLEEDDVVSITMHAVSGYTTPTISDITISTSNAAATATYNTEVLTVTITKDGGDGNLSTCSISAYNNSNDTLIGTVSNGQALNIPTGTVYYCVASSLDGYNLPSNSGKSAGTYTAGSSSRSLSFEYTEVQNLVDMGFGNILWATGNITRTGANTYDIAESHKSGAYFSYGDTVGHNDPDYNEGSTYSFSSSNYSSGASGSGHNLTADFSSGSTTYDAARVRLGSPWRMPTKSEYEALYNSSNTTSEWVSDYNSTGVAGRLFTSKSNGNTLFFPAVGYYDGTSLSYSGTLGYCWSSAYRSSSSAYFLDFSSSNVSTNYSNRYYGVSVRPVQDK